jgi:two-component system sensor histidine kinase MtrB
MGGIRARLAITLVALVAVTVTAIGVGVYAFVDASLRTRAIEEARREVDYGLSVLLPGADPAPVDVRSFEDSGLPTALALRGTGRVLADFGDGAPYEPDDLTGALAAVSPDLRAIVARGEIGYAWQALAGEPVLVVGGRAAGPPELFIAFPAAPIDAALAQLRVGLMAAGAAAIGVALLVAGLLARWILRPVGAAGRAARRLAAGDLAARVPSGGGDELGRLGGELNRMAEALEGTVLRLEDAQQQNRRFVADVAHELRTPLTALVAEASVIEGQTGSMPPDARRAAELLVTDVRRLRVLVDDLMEVSRFDSDAERPALEPVDLGRVVTGAVAARLPQAAVSLPPVPLVLDSDPRRLDRILGNLLDNARDHAPGSAVEVSLQQARDGAVIVVADRGPGVPADAIGHLFERFYKADPSRAGGSSGLGLAIAAEHAALLGASLRARNRPGGGLVVALTLPVTRPLPVGDAPDTGEADARAT